MPHANNPIPRPNNVNIKPVDNPALQLYDTELVLRLELVVSEPLANR